MGSLSARGGHGTGVDTGRIPRVFGTGAEVKRFCKNEPGVTFYFQQQQQESVGFL